MLIALTGKKGAGKDTFYQLLAELYPEKQVERRAFADAVKQCACALFPPITLGHIEIFKNDPEVKVSVVRESSHGRQVLSLYSFRHFLQRLGTDMGRENLGEDIWINMTLPNNDLHNGKVVCVTDVRFENEAEAICRMDGIVIKITRQSRNHLTWKAATEWPDDSHVSEAGVPAHLIDYVVCNDSSKSAFKDVIRYLIENSPDDRFSQLKIPIGENS